MIDLSFHFRESSEEEKKQILDTLKDVLDVSNIRCFTGKRWNNSGIAAVHIERNVCSILKVKMLDSVSTEFSDVCYFYEYLIYYLLDFAKRVEWKSCDSDLQNDFLQVIASFDRKVTGEGRIRTGYKAGVVNAAKDVLYFVEKHKKVFIKRLKKAKKEKPLPLPRRETGLPVDIVDVQSWTTAELGRMEYIVLKKNNEKYSLFPSSDDNQNAEILEAEKIWNFLDDDEDSCFTKEEIEAVREWMKSQLKNENSKLSRYFAQRHEEDEKRYQTPNR